MAPKRANRSDQNNSVSTTDISNTRTTEQERQWDGQPYQKVSWYMLNLRALFQEIPEARQYIESGVLVGSKTVTVYSLAHVQTYVNGDYERGTLKAPFDFSTLPNECTPISKPVAAAESPEDADSAQPSTPPSTEFIPTTLADLGVDTKRFVVAPEVIIQFEDQILRHWTNKILSPTDDVLRMHTFLVKYNATDDGASHLSAEYGMKMRIISAAAALTHIGAEDLPVMPPSSFGGKIDEIHGSATVRYCGPDAVAAGKGGDIYTPGRLIKFKNTPLRHLLCRVQPISLHGNRLEPKAAPPSSTLLWLQQHDPDGSATSGESTITDDQRARMTTQRAAALQIQKQREQTTNTTTESDGASDHDARTALVAEQKANVERIAKMQDQLNDLMDKMPSVTSTHDELRQQRELERERFAQERDERQQRERLRGFTKFAGFAALQMILLVIAFAAHKYFTKAGAALPLACITAITAPMVHAACVFFLTVVTVILRQANSSPRPWLSARSQDRARRKSNLSLYHLLVDGGPTWVKVAYVILRFFRVIPFKCITISAAALYSSTRNICAESSRTIQKLPRRARSYLLGQVPAGIYRTFMYDLRQVLIFTAEFHALLSLNWPVILARRLATGAARARYICNRAMNATLHLAIIAHYFLTLNWPMITWQRIFNLLLWTRRYGRTTSYLPTHAYQLGARGNAHRRSSHFLRTYSFNCGKFHLDAEGNRLFYNLNFHCARDPVTFT